jgi:CheY-like chemotaxis protein
MKSASSSSVAKTPLVLCVDDSDVALRVRKVLLADAGYNVLIATSGEEGLELFKRHSVDLVIADHFLTGKTGTEFAKEMKTLKPEVPVLLFSGAQERPDGTEFADEFLSKGQPPRALLEVVARLLA